MLKEKLRAQILGGSLQDYKNHLSGLYKGFYITIDVLQAQYLVKISMNPANDTDMAALNSFLNNQKLNQKKLVNVATGSHSIMLTIKMPSLAKNIPEVVNGIVDPVIDYLISYTFTSGCSECGTNMSQIDCYEINGGHYFLCDACKDKIHASLQASQQETQSKKSSLIAGLVGAFLGALIGCIFWVLIYKLGYIAGIAGAVTGICAMKGYTILGGHLDKKGVVGSAIIMLIMIYFANKVAWSWDAYSALKDYGWSFTECYQNLGYILDETDLVGSYYGELVIGYILTILCSAKSIINAFRESSGSYSIKKIN